MKPQSVTTSHNTSLISSYSPSLPSSSLPPDSHSSKQTSSLHFHQYDRSCDENCRSNSSYDSCSDPSAYVAAPKETDVMVSSAETTSTSTSTSAPAVPAPDYSTHFSSSSPTSMINSSSLIATSPINTSSKDSPLGTISLFKSITSSSLHSSKTLPKTGGHDIDSITTTTSIVTTSTASITATTAISPTTTQDLVDGGWRAWCVVLASFLIQTFAFAPTEFIYGVFQQEYLIQYSESSSSAVALIGTIGTTVTFLVGIFAGAYSERWGYRVSALLGTITMTMALVLASFATK
ncbi:hypothetical protein BX616_000580, partial [Lobosporangium transversale]